MRFAPKSEAQIQEERDAAMGVWPRGIYDFEVNTAEDKTSNKGNEMIELSVFVFNAEGDRKPVRDFLLEAMAHKLRHAAEAFGLLADYERGTLVADKLVGKTGRCKLGIEKGTGTYPDKNRIEDYEKPRAAGIGARQAPAARATVSAGGGDIDDDIPFGPCWQ